MTRSLTGTRITILGGGVIGLAAARAAARAGAQVLLLEARTVGQGATTAASGLITLALPGRSALVRLKREGYRAAERLLETLGDRLSSEHARRAGALTLRRELPTDADRAELERRWSEAGHLARWLSPEEAAALAPGLDPATFATALHFDQEIALDPDALVAALRRDFEDAGGKIVEGTGPLSLVPAGDDGVTAREESGKEVAGDADIILLAAGWESARALGDLPGTPLAVAPTGGVGIDLAHAAPGPTVHFGPDEEFHWVPRQRDQIYLGSTVRPEGETASYDRSEPERLLAAARVHFPELCDDAVIRVRDGLRPKAQRRGGPYIGPWPGRSRLWVATGHYRSGVANAAATAEILVASWGDGTAPDPAFAVARGLQGS